jgi:hypothetical protein
VQGTVRHEAVHVGIAHFRSGHKSLDAELNIFTSTEHPDRTKLQSYHGQQLLKAMLNDLGRLGRTFGTRSSLDYLAALAMAASSAEVSAAEFTAMNSGAGETVA